MNAPNNYSSTIQQIQECLSNGEATQACNLANHLLSEAPESPEVQFTCSGTFIDCGSDLRNIELIERGISLIEELKGRDDCPSRS